MGVPKFFRYMAERYPSVITPFKDSPPQVDNLYLDMNGIIHNCTHPNDFEATRKAPTEKEIIQAIFAYIEKLFNAVQPRKYFLMAIDGVAPRAKMNQQRQRRYRSGYEMMVAREEALKRGEDLPEEKDVFDSNCITPGTDFMVMLTEHFHYFIQMKLQTDTAWQNVKVIFSGHDHPGEGEHKIVDFIRGRKSEPGYSPHETHCMYGLDADLVMLALATHEPHFVLLREVVTFGHADRSRKEREKRIEDEARGIVASKAFQKEDEWVLFHIDILRDYLRIEVIDNLAATVNTLHGKLSAEAQTIMGRLDFERIVDDFVFMCFFVGNDFLPSIPTIGINDGHLHGMLELYRDQFLIKGEYLTEGGGNGIHWNVVERFLQIMGQSELAVLRGRQEEEKKFLERLAKQGGGDNEVRTNLEPITSMAEYKQRFYREKHEFEEGWKPSSADMQAMLLHYIEGLSWVQGYYYQGPPSWKWFYPHHYTPLASDLVGLAALANLVKFDKGEPFLPHQQLLAVLPPMSYLSMPDAYWPLLKSKNSPLARYFPEHLQIDREGARAPWEGIVLIPFMKEDALMAAYNSVQQNVKPADAKKNQLGKPVLFRYNPDTKKPYDLTNVHFPTIHRCLVDRVLCSFPKYDHFEAKLCKGIYTCDREGWSSLRSKRSVISPTYAVGAVCVFGQPTRKESCVLEIEEPAPMQSAEEGQKLVGQEILVGFPHYKRARVVAVADARVMYRAVEDDKGSIIRTDRIARNADESRQFATECGVHQQALKATQGINLPEVNVMVYVNRFTGMKMTRKMKLVRQFAKTETAYPIQICQQLHNFEFVSDTRYVERDIDPSSDETRCIYAGREPGARPDIAPIYGTAGRVVGRQEGATAGSEVYKVEVSAYTRLQGIPKALSDYAHSESWLSVADIARELKVAPFAVTAITSSVMTSPEYGSQEIGLCIKFTGKNLARLGYAKLVQKQRNPWYVGAGDIFARMDNDAEAAGHMANPAAAQAAAQQRERNEGGFGGGKGQFNHGTGKSANKSGAGTWFFSPLAAALIKEFTKRFEPLVRYLGESNCNVNSVQPSHFMVGKWSKAKVEDVLKEITAFVQQDGVLEQPMIPADEDSFTVEHLRDLEDFLEKSPARETKTLVVAKVSKRSLVFPTVKTGDGYNLSIPVWRDQRFRLGTRVTSCRTAGSVPFGHQGTIVRLMGSSAEIIFDTPFTGGTNLNGRIKTTRGAICKLSSLLVISEDDRSAEGSPAASASSPVAGVSANGSPVTIRGGDNILSELGRMLKVTSPSSIPVPAEQLAALQAQREEAAAAAAAAAQQQQKKGKHTDAAAQQNSWTPAPTAPADVVSLPSLDAVDAEAEAARREALHPSGANAAGRKSTKKVDYSKFPAKLTKDNAANVLTDMLAHAMKSM